MRATVIGVMGPGGNANDNILSLAEQLGSLIAQNGWTLLTGGRSEGVMEAASRGAKRQGGTTLGILPFRDFDASNVSSYVDIPILTGLGDARNAINVLTSQVVLVCGIGSGTASEAALALKANRPVILVAPDEATKAFFQSISASVHVAESPSTAIRIVKQLLALD